MTITIPPFAGIDETDAEDFYSAQLHVGGRDVEITLNFDSSDLDADHLNDTRKFIARADQIAAAAIDAIAKDFEAADQSQASRLYLEHCLDTIEEKDIVSVFGSSGVTAQQFIGALMLHRISLYPENDDGFAVLDYGLPEEYTDYLIVANFDRDAQLTELSVES